MFLLHIKPYVLPLGNQSEVPDQMQFAGLLKAMVQPRVFSQAVKSLVEHGKLRLVSPLSTTTTPRSGCYLFPFHFRGRRGSLFEPFMQPSQNSQ